MWKWLNGRKTTIGAICFLTATILEKVVGGIWGMDNPILPKLVETFQWAGTAIGGLGIGHKIVKAGGSTG